MISGIIAKAETERIESMKRDTCSGCEKCQNLMELYEQAPKTDRNYWIMTELFFDLHNQKDYCDNETED